MEVEFIWKSRPKITLSNGLFIFNRYFPLLRVTMYAAFSFSPARSDTGCNRGTDFNSYATMFNIAIVERKSIDPPRGLFSLFFLPFW